jgi:hypothetical protein
LVAPLLKKLEGATLIRHGGRCASSPSIGITEQNVSLLKSGKVKGIRFATLPKAEVCLSALTELIGTSSWFAGQTISLAHLHAAPMFALFRLAPEVHRLLERYDSLTAWWGRISTRPSFVRTQPSLNSAPSPAGSRPSALPRSCPIR